MKKLFLILLAFTLANHLEAQEVYIADFTSNRLLFDNVVADDNNTYTTIRLEGTDGFTSESGKPMLPSKTIRLMIPFGKSVSGVSIQTIGSQEFELIYPIYPTDSVSSLNFYYICKHL